MSKFQKLGLCDDRGGAEVSGCVWVRVNLRAG